MSNVSLPLRFSPLALAYLALIHLGAVLCLVPLHLSLATHVIMLLGIVLSFVYACQRHRRLRVFQRLEWQVEPQSWQLSDAAGQYSVTLRMRPGCWVAEHFVWLAFKAEGWPGSLSLLFAFDQYSVYELKQLRRAVLQHQHFLKQTTVKVEC